MTDYKAEYETVKECTDRNVYVEDFIFETEKDANSVLDKLKIIIDTYGNATVADLYDLSGRDDGKYMDTKQIWTNLESAFVIKVNNGYGLYLPKPIYKEK